MILYSAQFLSFPGFSGDKFKIPGFSRAFHDQNKNPGFSKISREGGVRTLKCIVSTDEDPSLRIQSLAIINSRSVSTKLN